jgi:hypothetical protein
MRLIREWLTELFWYPEMSLSDAVATDAHWGDTRSRSGTILTRWQRARVDLALSHMDHTNPVTLLEIGCRNGAVLAYLMNTVHVSRAIGVDVSETMLAEAASLGIEAIRSQADPLKSLPLALHADYVLSFEILERMLNPEAQLRAMMEIAERGVFFSFPNTGYITFRLRLLFGRFPLQWRVHPSDHVRFWTYADLVWWLRALGYQTYTIHAYEGVPVLNKIWPSLFARGLFIYIPVNTKS